MKKIAEDRKRIIIYRLRSVGVDIKKSDVRISCSS